MPAKRMKAAVGSTLKVIGRRSAMVSAGPSPGRTPIAVPSVVPTRHHSRLIGVSATAKPLRSCEKASMSAALGAYHPFDRVLDQPGPDIDAKRLGEADIRNEGEGCTDQGIAHDCPGAESARHADEQDHRRDGEPGPGNQENVEHQPGDDPEQRLSIRRNLLLFRGLPAPLYG